VPRLNRGTLVAIAAALMLGIGAGVGTGALSVNETRFRAAYSRLDFKLSGVEQVVTCAVTLEGSFHSATFATVRGVEAGQFTRAATGACTGGRVTLESETLPWPFDYLATLLSPLGFTSSWLGLALRIEASGLTCSGSVGAEKPTITFQYDSSSTLTQAVDNNGSTVPMRGGLCEGLHVSLEGSAPVVRGAGEGGVSLRLI
jgi:hypothetical protein